jgi:pyruvate/2-oxoglutarate/acetoin dehydrogenase E1 component
MACINEQAFYEQDAPMGRACTVEVPIPYPRYLEETALPNPEKIVAMAQKLMETT